jgi:catechol 2,3-dioxygenase-like lactoylglutathione lyase family enzyme
MSQIYGIDHIQLSIPPGGEGRARAFYAGLLGLVEAEKPASLAGRGGAWFEAGSLKLHLGVEPDMRPMKKAHPGLLVHGLADLVARLEASGVAVTYEPPLPGFDRAHILDPFGNRIELLEVKP